MKSSNYIAESTFNVNLNYAKLQNKTEELFFRCLDEGRDEEYFKKQLEKIWGKENQQYMENAIEEYSEMIHEKNIEGKEIIEEKNNNALFTLVPLTVVAALENKFKKYKEREYKKSYNSPAYKNDKKEYIKTKLQRYDDEIVPYYKKGTNTIMRYVQLSTYVSMIHNTNLVRSGWNTTLDDADSVGQTKFWIPYHPFSCPYCLSHQNQILTKKDILKMGRKADKAQGDILHPNCKCEITFYMSDTEFNDPDYSPSELDEQYKIRQKVNGLTLKKEKVKTQMKIAENANLPDEFDKYNSQRNQINKEIRELKKALPTASLRKQVVAINR